MIAGAARRGGPGQDDPRDRSDLVRRPSARDRRQGRRGWLSGPLPILAVLVIQVGLELRLIWSNTAFQDEALYLQAGHLQWAQWLHGVPTAAEFPRYLSGALAVYPPLGALADSAGGLAGARLLSVAFMLATTWLLWSATRRLFGDRAAIIAAALFAGTAASQFVGALATYDAMALMLLAAAAWCAVRSGDGRRRSQVLLIAAAIALLVLANAAKYASVLWDPVVLALAALTDARYRGWLSGLATGIAATVAVASALGYAVVLAGPVYLAGIRFSTLDRRIGPVSPLAVLQNAGYWTGAVLVLAVAGAVILTRARFGRALTLTGWTLVGAALLAPAEQARIHTNVSLFKHVGYGGWFAAIIAGYAIAALSEPAAARKRRLVAAIAPMALLAMGVIGAIVASHHYDNWENSTALVARLRPLAVESPGPSLAEEPSVLNYYLRQSGATFTGTFSFHYNDPVTGKYLAGIPAYADAIKHHHFKLVVIGFTTTTVATDQAIVSDLRQNLGYRLVAAVPWSSGQHSGRFLIWRYQPACSRHCRSPTHRHA